MIVNWLISPDNAVLDKRTVSFGVCKISWEFFVSSETRGERVVFLWWEKVVKAGIVG